MRIVNRTTFLTLPVGTIYSVFRPDMFEGLYVKEKTIRHSEDDHVGDWFYTSLIGNLATKHSLDYERICDRLWAEPHHSTDLDFDTLNRWGDYDEHVRYGIYEKRDLDSLLAKLQRL